jgi:Zn-dependent peptidase ImmA (M78 family)/transcriptional regulator with XRE-family HTH domain
MALDRQMFSEKLRRYMDQLQVSVDDLAGKTGVAADRIAAMLSGSVEPTGDEVLIFSDYFKCDFVFFISNQKLAPFEQTESLFRKHGTDLTAEDRWAIQEFLYLCECEMFLLAELRPGPRNPFACVKQGNHYKSHGQDAARLLRQHLRYSQAEIPANVFRVFRDIGLHVFRRRLGKSSISGLFVRHPSAGGCVLVNYSEDVFRQRFTACHEAGHALLDDDEEFVVSFSDRRGHDTREVRANTFASRFLLPPETLNAIPDCRSWTAGKLVHHASRLMVNTETLLYALEEASLLTESQVELLRGVKVPPTAKVDPELPASLASREMERKRKLLQRGLSDSYVELAFEAYHRGVRECNFSSVN